MQGKGEATRDTGRAVADEGATDELLIARVADGDLSAFESLYRRFFPRLTRFLERMTRRPRLVEEVLNDTMYVVWRKAHSYNRTSKVSTWVFAIAYRKALKALRHQDEPVEEDADAGQVAADVAAGPEGTLQQKQVRAMVGKAMATLSSEQRAVVELTYFHGYSYPEIAAIMDCPVDTVKTRMFYARRRLRAVIADREGARP